MCISLEMGRDCSGKLQFTTSVDQFQWIAEWSLLHTMHFSEVLRLLVCGWHAARVWVVKEVGEAFSLSNDIESTVASRFKNGGWRGLARQQSGRNTVRFGVERDQPADDRRRGDAKSLECVTQIWGAGRHLLLVADAGTV